jgi:hypothetical protein
VAKTKWGARDNEPRMISDLRGSERDSTRRSRREHFATATKRGENFLLELARPLLTWEAESNLHGFGRK